jgi:hypothetical protein
MSSAVFAPCNVFDCIILHAFKLFLCILGMQNPSLQFVFNFLFIEAVKYDCTVYLSFIFKRLRSEEVNR